MKLVVAAISILVLVFVSGSIVLVGGAVSIPASYAANKRLISCELGV